MEYSNEELVQMIQSGQNEYIPQLWEQVQDFIRYMASRHLQNYPSNCEQLFEDMVNQSYFHFLRAVEGYREGKGKFTGYLAYHIKNAFNEVLQGRTARAQNEPLNSAVSMDTPVNGTEDITLADMLIDDTAEAYYRYLEDEDFWHDVRRVLHKAADVVPPAYQEFFHVMIDNGTGVSDTLRIMEIDLAEKHRYYEQYRKGLRKMKGYLNRYVRETKDIALEECISYYTGVGSWRNRGFTSTVEQAVMQHIDHRFTAYSVGEVLTLQP